MGKISPGLTGWPPRAERRLVPETSNLKPETHLASTFLGKHCTHRVEGTFSSMHVIIHGRRFMCMRTHSGKFQWKMGVRPSSIANGDSRRLLEVRLLN